MMEHRPTEARVGEPGRVGVEVDVVYTDWQIGAAAPRNTDTHQWVLLLGRHHHFKHSHRVGKGEIKMLQVWRREDVSQDLNPPLMSWSICLWFVISQSADQGKLETSVWSGVFKWGNQWIFSPKPSGCYVLKPALKFNSGYKILYFSLPVVILLTTVSVNSPINLSERPQSVVRGLMPSKFCIFFVMNVHKEWTLACLAFMAITVCYTTPLLPASRDMQPSVQNICKL